MISPSHLPVDALNRWLLKLRFSPKEAIEYERNLKAAGFDDIQAICEVSLSKAARKTTILPCLEQIHRCNL